MTKFAFLVGCNYTEIESMGLRGCHNDVRKMRQLLTSKLEFDAANIQVLTDEPASAVQPTGANIKAALYRMAHNSKAGDVLSFYVSGHGYIEDINMGNLCARQEYIVPVDCNLICCQDFQYICFGIPEGANLTVLSDSCHSGGLIYTGKEQIGPGIPAVVCIPLPDSSQNRNIRLLAHGLLLDYIIWKTGREDYDVITFMTEYFQEDASHRFSGKQRQEWTVDGGILISACRPDEVAWEDQIDGIKCGKFTSEMVKLLMNIEDGVIPITNRAVVESARNILTRQHPCLYCTDSNVDQGFWARMEGNQRSGKSSNVLVLCFIVSLREAQIIIPNNQNMHFLTRGL